MQSSWEKLAESLLRKKKVKYKKEYQILAFRKYRLDFICIYQFWKFSGRQFAIEVDGKQHEGLLNRLYDISRDRRIKRFSNVKIYRVSYKNLKRKILLIILYEKIRFFFPFIFIFLLLIVWLLKYL